MQESFLIITSEIALKMIKIICGIIITAIIVLVLNFGCTRSDNINETPVFTLIQDSVLIEKYSVAKLHQYETFGVEHFAKSIIVFKHINTMKLPYPDIWLLDKCECIKYGDSVFVVVEDKHEWGARQLWIRIIERNHHVFVRFVKDYGTDILLPKKGEVRVSTIYGHEEELLIGEIDFNLDESETDLWIFGYFACIINSPSEEWIKRRLHSPKGNVFYLK